MKKVFTNKKHIIAILFLFLLVFSFLRRSSGVIQEDNYVGYAQSLGQGLHNLSRYDSRLYPGFPILISLTNIIVRNHHISALIIIYLSFIASFLLLKKITKSKSTLFIFLFPPVMLDVASRITNEYLLVLLVLLSVYFFINKKYTISSLMAGLSIWVRPAGIMLFPAIIISLVIFNKNKLRIKQFVAFFLPVFAFMIYNKSFFGTFSPIYQLLVYKSVSPYGNAVGFIQIFEDILRAYKWSQYRIFLSGLFYTVIFYTGIIYMFKNIKSYYTQTNIFIAISIFLIIFQVFIYSFSPFLENLARYIVPIVPLWWILFEQKSTIPKYAYSLAILSIIITLI